MMKINWREERASTLIELAFAIPIVLAIIFFLISFSLARNADYSLHPAMASAVQLAFLRSNNNRVRTDLIIGKNLDGMIDQINDWYNGDPEDFSAIPLALFGRGLDQSTLSDNMEQWVFKNFVNDPKPYDYPVSYYYALFYIYQAMEQTMGKGLRYPCDYDQPNCLLCTFQGPSLGYPVGLGVAGTVFPDDTIHIRCRVRPWTSLFGSVFRLLGGSADAYGPLIDESFHGFSDQIDWGA